MRRTEDGKAFIVTAEELDRECREADARYRREQEKAAKQKASPAKETPRMAGTQRAVIQFRDKG